ncbi:MAG: hypothetical protein ACN4G0_01930 [Polyangiales bacterium]
MRNIGYAALLAMLSLVGCGSATLDDLGSDSSRSSDGANEPAASEPGSPDPGDQGPSDEDPLGQTPVGEDPPANEPPGEDPPVSDPPTTDPPGSDPPNDDPVDLPAATCAAPTSPVDTSNATTVVGDGTPGSCTETVLRDAVARGGIVTFDCGPSIKTISVSQTLVAASNQNTTIDGNHKIVLDGGGGTQILRAYDGDWRNNQATLTVQRLVMQRGHDTGTGYRPRDGDKVCAWGYRDGGGGAIFTRNVNVHVWGVTFLDNQGPEIGPDVAGGAIYVLGSIELVVTNSVFRGNSASNGGAIGVLHTSSYMYNVIFEDNAATGMLANYYGGDASGCPEFAHAQQGGAGGLGGAYYIDGQDPEVVFCGVEMSNNISGDLGGAVFASRYWGLLGGRQTITWEKSVFNGNYSPTGGGGAAYLNNSYFTLNDCSFEGNSAGNGDGGALKLTGLTLNANNVTFTNNSSAWGGAVAHWEGGPEGVGSASNLTLSGNEPNDFVGDFPAP